MCMQMYGIPVLYPNIVMQMYRIPVLCSNIACTKVRDSCALLKRCVCKCTGFLCCAQTLRVQMYGIPVLCSNIAVCKCMGFLCCSQTYCTCKCTGFPSVPDYIWVYHRNPVHLLEHSNRHQIHSKCRFAVLWFTSKCWWSWCGYRGLSALLQ